MDDLNFFLITFRISAIWLIMPFTTCRTIIAIVHQYYSNSTSILQQCYSNITAIIQQYYITITAIFQKYYSSIIAILQYFNNITLML